MLRKYNVCLNDNTKSFDVMLPEQRQFDVFLQGSYVQREFDVFLQGSQVHGNIFISALPSLYSAQGQSKVVLDANANIEKSICVAVKDTLHICSHLSDIYVESSLHLLSGLVVASEACLLAIVDVGQLHSGTTPQANLVFLSANVCVQAYSKLNIQTMCDASTVILRRVHELSDIYIDDMDSQSLRDVDYTVI